jgi:hypothetical protein
MNMTAKPELDQVDQIHVASRESDSFHESRQRASLKSTESNHI